LSFLNSSLISNSVILKTLWCIHLHYTYCAVPACRTAEPWVNTGHMCSAHLSCKGGTVPIRISAKNTKIVWGGKLFKRTVHVISCAQTLEKMYSWFTNLYLMSKMSKISFVFYLIRFHCVFSMKPTFGSKQQSQEGYRQKISLLK